MPATATSTSTRAVVQQILLLLAAAGTPATAQSLFGAANSTATPTLDYRAVRGQSYGFYWKWPYHCMAGGAVIALLCLTLPTAWNYLVRGSSVLGNHKRRTWSRKLIRTATNLRSYMLEHPGENLANKPWERDPQLTQLIYPWLGKIAPYIMDTPLLHSPDQYIWLLLNITMLFFVAAQLIAAEVIVEKLAEECIPQYDCFAVNKTRHQELGCMWSGIPDEGDPCFAFHKGVKADCSGATEYDLETTHLQCFMMKDYEHPSVVFAILGTVLASVAVVQQIFITFAARLVENPENLFEFVCQVAKGARKGGVTGARDAAQNEAEKQAEKEEEEEALQDKTNASGAHAANQQDAGDDWQAYIQDGLTSWVIDLDEPNHRLLYSHAANRDCAPSGLIALVKKVRDMLLKHWRQFFPLIVAVVCVASMFLVWLANELEWSPRDERPLWKTGDKILITEALVLVVVQCLRAHVRNEYVALHRSGGHARADRLFWQKDAVKEIPKEWDDFKGDRADFADLARKQRTFSFFGKKKLRVIDEWVDGKYSNDCNGRKAFFAEFIKEHPIYEFKTAPDYPKTVLQGLCEHKREIDFWKKTAVKTLTDSLRKKNRVGYVSGNKKKGESPNDVFAVKLPSADRNTEGLAEAIVNTFVKDKETQFDLKQRVNEHLLERVKSVLPGPVREVLEHKPPESIEEELSRMNIKDCKHRIERYLGSKHRDPEKANIKARDGFAYVGDSIYDTHSRVLPASTRLGNMLRGIYDPVGFSRAAISMWRSKERVDPPEITYLRWDELPTAKQVDLGLLGYTKYRWDHDINLPVSWLELTLDRQKLASILGWDEASWAEGPFKTRPIPLRRPYDALAVEAQQMLRIIGLTPFVWNMGPDGDERWLLQWHELSNSAHGSGSGGHARQEAAKRLGLTEAWWDENSDVAELCEADVVYQHMLQRIADHHTNRDSQPALPGQCEDCLEVTPSPMPYVNGAYAANSDKNIGWYCKLCWQETYPTVEPWLTVASVNGANRPEREIPNLAYAPSSNA